MEQTRPDTTLIPLAPAAAACGVSVATLRKWAAEDVAPLHRVGREDCLHWKDLRKLLLRRRRPIPPSLDGWPKILVVDDDEGLLLVLLESLELAFQRARVATASDAARGMHRLLTFKPDLAVIDMRLPDALGLELCRWIRTQPDLARTKVLAITGEPRAWGELPSLDLGVDEFLRKPLEPANVVAVARRLLGQPPPLAVGAAAPRGRPQPHQGGES